MDRDNFPFLEAVHFLRTTLPSIDAIFTSVSSTTTTDAPIDLHNLMLSTCIGLDREIHQCLGSTIIPDMGSGFLSTSPNVCGPY